MRCTVQEVGSTGFTSAVLQEQAYSAVQSEQQPTTVITSVKDRRFVPCNSVKICVESECKLLFYGNLHGFCLTAHSTDKST